LTYRLTRKAEEDILQIYAAGSKLFGEPQADRYHESLAEVFGIIAMFPGIARERTEIVPPVRIHPHHAHLIVYRIEADGSVLIIRIRHGREDWVSDLG
jgi:toxin ParE1/3/4